MRQQNCEWLFYCFNIERNYDVSKNLCILLYKNVNFNKNEMQSEMENPAHIFRQTNLVLQLIWESQIKNKTVMSWNSWKKKEGIFYTIYFVQRIFFHICLLPQWITYWICFQNIHTFSHQKSLPHTHFCFFLKSWKAFCDFLRKEMFIAFFVKYKKRLTEIKMIRYLGCSIFLTLQRKVTFLAPTTNLEGLKTKFLIHFLFRRTLIAAVKAIHALYWIDSSFWYSFL